MLVFTDESSSISLTMHDRVWETAIFITSEGQNVLEISRNNIYPLINMLEFVSFVLLTTT